jgi:hypothetical protein
MGKRKNTEMKNKHCPLECPESLIEKLRCCYRHYPEGHGQRKWILKQTEKEEGKKSHARTTKRAENVPGVSGD